MNKDFEEYLGEAKPIDIDSFRNRKEASAKAKKFVMPREAERTIEKEFLGFGGATGGVATLELKKLLQADFRTAMKLFAVKYPDIKMNEQNKKAAARAFEDGMLVEIQMFFDSMLEEK